MICFNSSSNPTSKIRSASSITRHWRFLYMNPGVFWQDKGQKGTVSCRVNLSVRRRGGKQCPLTCMWSRRRPGVATTMLIPLASFCASADLLLPPIINPYVWTWWVISSLRTPKVCMASSLVGERIRTPVPKKQNRIYGESQTVVTTRSPSAGMTDF